MGNNENQNSLSTIENLAEDARTYANMRVDAFKLAAIENLSVIIGNSVALIAAMLLGTIALLIFSAAVIYGLSKLIQSMTWAIVIVGGVYTVAAIIAFSLRNRFANNMVPMFSRMLFPQQKNEEEEQADEK